MFFGSHHHTLDEKGRVSIPKEFRLMMQSSFMEDRLMVACYYDNRLRAFLPEDWKKLVMEVAEMDTRNQDNRDFQMFILGGAHLCRLDGQGRILLPEELRQYAGITRDVMMVGQGKGIDIWAKEQFQNVWGRAVKKANDLPEFPPQSVEKKSSEED